MKARYLYLIFIALFVALFAASSNSIFTDSPWIQQTLWILTGVLLVSWAYLDADFLVSLPQKKHSRSSVSSIVAGLLCLVIFSGLGYVSSQPRFNRTFDLTRSRLNTLSDSSVKTLEQINKSNKKISIITFFANPEPKKAFEDLLNLYRQKGLDSSIEHYDTQADYTKAQSYEISDANTVIFSTGDREKRITLFNEEKITNALLALAKEGRKKLYFTKGHGESDLNSSDAEGANNAKTELENNNYEVAQISLIESNRIPEDVAMVAILNPKYDFNLNETELLDNYLKQGGALFVSAGAVVKLENLNTLLTKYGITLNNDILILKPGDVRSQLYGQNNALISDFNTTNPITRDFGSDANVGLLMSTSRSISTGKPVYEDINTDVLARTNPITIRVRDVNSQKDLKNIGPERIDSTQQTVMASAFGKFKSTTSPSVEKAQKSLDENHQTPQTRLVVVGSSNIGNNIGLSQPARRDLFLNTMSYLASDDEFVSIRPPQPEKSTLNLASASSRLMLRFIVFIYPLIFLVGGFMRWFSRRKA